MSDVVRTQDEALALALAESQPGDVVSVHTAECAQRSNDERECTCTPLVLTTGATA